MLYGNKSMCTVKDFEPPLAFLYFVINMGHGAIIYQNVQKYIDVQHQDTGNKNHYFLGHLYS